MYFLSGSLDIFFSFIMDWSSLITLWLGTVFFLFLVLTVHLSPWMSGFIIFIMIGVCPLGFLQFFPSKNFSWYFLRLQILSYVRPFKLLYRFAGHPSAWVDQRCYVGWVDGWGIGLERKHSKLGRGWAGQPGRSNQRREGCDCKTRAASSFIPESWQALWGKNKTRRKWRRC